MIPEPDSEEKLPFHLGFALVITICAVFAQFALLLTLATAAGESSPAHMGIATLVGYGAMFALAVPRMPDAPGVSMGLKSVIPTRFPIRLPVTIALEERGPDPILVLLRLLGIAL